MTLAHLPRTAATIAAVSAVALLERLVSWCGRSCEDAGDCWGDDDG